MSWTRNILIIVFAVPAYVFALVAASKVFEYFLLRYEFRVLPVALLEQSVIGGLGGFAVARLLKNPNGFWYATILLSKKWGQSRIRGK